MREQHVFGPSLLFIVGFTAAGGELTEGGSTSTDVLRDGLCITEMQVYDTAYPSFCGGRVFGKPHDLQCADVFETPKSYWITSITVDYLTAYGTLPDKLCLTFYQALDGGRFDDNAYATREILPGRLGWYPFEDILFGVEGRRALLALDGPGRLPAGRWLVSVQYSSEEDAAYVVAISFQSGHDLDCLAFGSVATRDGREYAPCCLVEGPPELWTDWRQSGSFEPDTLCTRVEGIPAGDCVGGEQVTAQCKPRRGGGGLNLIVKVRNGQANGTVTALLDPPDPSDIRVPLDDRGRGKGRFKRVPMGDHRVFVCDSIVSATCSP